MTKAKFKRYTKAAQMEDEILRLRTELAVVTKQRDDLRIVQTAWLADRLRVVLRSAKDALVDLRHHFAAPHHDEKLDAVIQQQVKRAIAAIDRVLDGQA